MMDHVLRVHGYDGGVPTRLLVTALGRLIPWALERTPPGNEAYLRITARCGEIHGGRGCGCSRPAHAGAWYDVDYVHDDARDGEILTHRIAHAVALPAPPVIPVEERLAAAPEPCLRGWTAGQIAVMGGEEAALDVVGSRQAAAIRDARTADIYDWDAAAAGYLQRLAALPHRRLDPGQRVAAARARLLRAERELTAARVSLDKRRANAARANGH
ncbi:hypothetical protein [Marinactinospora rubrisoli]|uniref:Uncharacterized protein n=1 Tax=Marinactinospora rubrisoli TaxID=2715399 RepID=A0ABW2KQ43_9ACTN